MEEENKLSKNLFDDEGGHNVNSKSLFTYFIFFMPSPFIISGEFVQEVCTSCDTKQSIS